MDHLPLPTNPSLPTLNIPFVCTSGYDLNAGPFHEFPARFLQSLGSDGTQPVLDRDEALLSLIQAWLFFGSMSEFFQTEIDIEAFRKKETGQRHLISTSGLMHFREQWLRLQQLTADDKPKASVQKQLIVLIQASHACEQFEKANFSIPRLEEILISIRLLLCSLAITAKGIMKESPDLDHLLQRLTLRSFGRLHAPIDEFRFLDHMVRNGWCPFQVEHLVKTCCASTMFYFVCLNRNRPEVDHHLCTGASSCLAHRLDVPSFVHRHVDADCQCDIIEVDEVRLMQILEDGKTPLVSCQLSREGSITPSLVAAETKSSYTAISHVWIDGLGNPRENALTQCQLRRLVARARVLQAPENRPTTSVNLWLDTFCIPVESKGDRLDFRRQTLKKRAIASMTPIYARAERVLVLDSEVNGLSHRDYPFSELTARLSVCGWMSRAWTLQEGSLARRLCYQFLDGFLFVQEGQQMFDEIMKIASWNNSHDERMHLLQDCRQAWYLPAVGRHVEDASNGLTGRDVQFLEVWNSLINKYTTKQDDFHEILANLLDFGLQEIRMLESQRERMKAMVLCQGRLPLDMFCLPTDEKTNSGGAATSLSWIPLRPKNFTLQRTSFTRSIRRCASGFIFDNLTGPPGYIIHAANLATQTFCVLPLGSATAAHAEVTLPLNMESYPEHPVALYLCFATVSGHPLVRDTKHYGSCFVVQKRKKNRLTVKYLCTLTFNQCWHRHLHNDTGHPVFPAQQVGVDIIITLDPGVPFFRLRFRRPLNIARLGLQITPRKKLWYVSGSVTGAIVSALVFILLLGVVISGILLAFLAPVLILAVFIALFYGLKYFQAYNWWLNSYTELRLPILFLVFIKALEIEEGFNRYTMRFLVPNMWHKYARSRQERWDRSERDIGSSKIKSDNREEFIQAHRPSLYSFSHGITSETGFQVEPTDASHLIGRAGSQVILSLYRPMASTPH